MSAFPRTQQNLSIKAAVEIEPNNTDSDSPSGAMSSLDPGVAAQQRLLGARIEEGAAIEPERGPGIRGSGWRVYAADAGCPRSCVALGATGHRPAALDLK
jgi:hypothetical protein